MKNIIMLLLLVCAVNSSTVAQRSSFVSPLSLLKDGYKIDFGENVLDPVAAKSISVDVALVDFSALSGAKSEIDSTKIIERIYHDPGKFSIVTGTLEYLTGATAKLLTRAKFAFDLNNSKYTMVVVENNGKDNSGTKIAPLAFYSSDRRGRCRACGCNCYKTTRGCTYCGIIVSR